jgi:lysophospholipid acyltransferase (LPLAT)-like uncharacterized protein
MARRRTWLGRLRRRITRSDAFVALAAGLGTLIFRAYGATIRMDIQVHPETAALDRSRVLYAFWHGRQFLLIPSFRHQGIAVMADLSWAGRIQAGIMERMGYPVVRGSSKRKAAQALADMKRAIESGCSAAFAVDGPRGPIHRSKPGIIYLAQKLGYPIVPVATSARPALVMEHTWCRYLLPAPFSRGLVGLGRPITDAADGRLTAEELDAILEAWTAEIDGRLGVAPDVHACTPQ